MTERWYCGYTLPWQEFRARDALEQARFTVLLPTYTPPRKDYVQPLFPRYIFIRFDVDRDVWQRAWRVPGIRSILGAAENPLAISDEAIDVVVQQVALQFEADAQRKATMAKPIPKGAVVRIQRKNDTVIEHDLTGICKWSTLRRVAVLVEMMGREVQVVCDRNEVEIQDGSCQTPPIVP